MSSMRRTRTRSGPDRRSAGSIRLRSRIPRLRSTRPSPTSSPSSHGHRCSPLRVRRHIEPAMRDRECGAPSAARLWLCAAVVCVAGCLAACTGMSRVSADTPAGVNLAGTWKLDPQHSTDSRKALDDLQKTARKAQPRARAGGLGGGSDAALLAPPTMVFAPDVSEQRSLLANGDWLKIEQRPDEVVISNVQGSRSYIPG